MHRVVFPFQNFIMTEVSGVSGGLPAHHAYKVDAGALQLPLYLCCQVLLMHSTPFSKGTYTVWRNACSIHISIDDVAEGPLPYMMPSVSVQLS